MKRKDFLTPTIAIDEKRGVATIYMTSSRSPLNSFWHAIPLAVFANLCEALQKITPGQLRLRVEKDSLRRRSENERIPEIFFFASIFIERKGIEVATSHLRKDRWSRETLKMNKLFGIGHELGLFISSGPKWFSMFHVPAAGFAQFRAKCLRAMRVRN